MCTSESINVNIKQANLKHLFSIMALLKMGTTHQLLNRVIRGIIVMIIKLGIQSWTTK